MNMIDDSIAEAPPIPLTRAEWQTLRITSNDGEDLVTIDLKTGKHTFGENADINEAARIFWRCVSDHFNGTDVTALNPATATPIPNTSRE